MDPPSELKWIMPKISSYNAMSLSERAKGKRYKRPSDELIFNVMEKIDLPIDDISKKSIEFLYEKSSTPSPYFPDKFSIYKTTHLVSEKIDKKGFRNTLRFKHLEWVLTKTREILEANPNLEGRLKQENINFKDLLSDLSLKYKGEKIRELLSQGRSVGYSQYSTSPVDAFEVNNAKPVRESLMLTKGAQSLYSKFLESIGYFEKPNIPLIQKRLFESYRLGMVDPYIGFESFYRRKVTSDLLSIYRHNLKKDKAKVSKKDVKMVLKRRLGFIVQENEDIEDLLSKKVRFEDEELIGF